MNFPTESVRGWEEVLRALQKRGLEQVGLVVADGLSGLEEAAVRVLGNVPFQKCGVHLERNVLSRIKPGDKKAVGNELSEVFVTDKKDEGPEKGWNRWEEFIDRWKKRYPSLKNYLEKTQYYAHFT
ncbi:MAG: hypothetical protein OHK0019_31310 [Saprospiraceae bacterium]